jgi:hypothetical protein
VILDGEIAGWIALARPSECWPPVYCYRRRYGRRTRRAHLSSDRCPTQINLIAEAYVMNTLARVDTVAFEEHLLVCSCCRAAVEDAEHYVRAMKIAAQRLRSPKARTAGAA